MSGIAPNDAYQRLRGADIEREQAFREVLRLFVLHPVNIHYDVKTDRVLVSLIMGQPRPADPVQVDAAAVEASIKKLSKSNGKRAKSKPSERKAWALGQLRSLIKGGDAKPQQTLLKRWNKKWRIHDRATRARLQRSFLRWCNEVEAEIAAERKSDK